MLQVNHKLFGYSIYRKILTCQFIDIISQQIIAQE